MHQWRSAPLGMPVEDVFHSVVFFLLLTWLLLHFLRPRRALHELQEEGSHGVFPEIIVLFNVLNSIISLGFLSYEVWKMKGIPLGSLFLSLSWMLVTFLTIHSRKKAGAGGWPSVLLSWWALSSTSQLFFMSVYLLNYFKPKHLPAFFPAATVGDLATFPLSAALCISVLAMKSSKAPRGIKQPLLVEDEDDSCSSRIFSDAGIWSRLIFKWLNPLFEKGRKQRLKLHHVPRLPFSETAEAAQSILQQCFRRQKPECMTLTRAVVNAAWRPLAINAALAGINTLASYLGPFLITNLVEFLSREDTERNHGHGYMLAFIFFFAKTVESLSQRHWYFGARQIGIRVRAALMVSLYTKTLAVKYSRTSCGKIINFLDVDVERIGDFFWYIHGIWLLPVQVTLALIILSRSLGAQASVAALLATIMIMVSNTPLANSQERLHARIMEAKDDRIKATSEALKCMRILKLHSWEKVYLNRILQLRDAERTWLKRYLYACSAITFLFWTSPTLVSVIAFGVCFFVKTPLTPGTVLSALATFRILQEPIYNLPELVSAITQTKVSLDRIQNFIQKEEQKNLTSNNSTKHSEVAVEVEPGEYSWLPESSSVKPTLKIDQKLKIMKGKKVAVCGSVGSGKSSFLSSLMGEMPRLCGTGSRVFGSRAYVPQIAWIQTGTVRDNILFGKKMIRAFYDQVIDGCALDRDIALWAEGDLTVVGERGMNLSGGQKQRIQLARSIYSDSDVLFLDDPFSAVDAHTGAHIFKECLMQLLSSKTIIYATHQLEFLDAADLILVMKNGRIAEFGKYEDLICYADGELVRLMAAHNKSLCQVTPQREHHQAISSPQKKSKMELREEKPSSRITNSETSERIFEEERESGRVKWSIYRTFVTSAYKGALVPVILLCQILFQGLQMASSYWIAWATDKEDKVSKGKLMGVFVLVSAGSSLFVLGRAVLLATIAIETAQCLFLRMTNSIFQAPIFFFDSTPSSRIINRSSADQSIVDTDIPYRLAGLVFALVQLLCIIILMSQVAWPVFVLFVIILAISIWYQATRELARMVGTRKAPILHHFSETVSGASTIRCFNQEDRFLAKSLSLIDDYSRITFHNSATMEWLCVRINFLFNLVFFLALMMLVSMPRNGIDPSLVGLAATYGLNLNVLQAWVIWNLCNVENKMISVERILQFSSIASEAPLVIENSRPEQEWPRYGTIVFKNLHIQYSPSHPMVLKGITCIFPGGSKIGVVGRTGSGKSTLTQALFRVVEPALGSITIDGLDICNIGLHDLRSRLSIIPQDPIMFQGTVRINLDPLQEHTDSEIWEALHKCEFADIVTQECKLLDAPVAEDGENWSVGQRQLVCLARVLLKRRRILVLDEATASVDTATDNFIQRVIEKETSCCTLIIVAHRIPTVVDSDLVMVLDEGKILEFSSPADLLKDKSSAFSQLAMEFLRRTKSNQAEELT
ncbi:ABC transporter C family member 3 [Apostasia shenzhenica]|uniref:ABC transporter C family member 3 n=1 Tax=Apostasia shenzhenica TaxID=1088818 RepID=A0A2I0B3F1_9ASPA|nr:ABC transporter C family member 3 [Apostasia shenzhenica]